ncbi:MAG: copper resistance CopC family protein [Xanthobacteraceae bacterium]|jgi:methionine-rich copper-binding protein CopC
MRTIIASSTALLLVMAAVSAQAHAFLDRAEPRVGSSVAAAPRQVSLWFTQSLEPAFSTVEVQDSAGARVDQGGPRVDPAHPSVMRIAVKPLPPGTYKVRWRVLSVDTHTTEGSFSFRVGSP